MSENEYVHLPQVLLASLNLTSGSTRRHVFPLLAHDNSVDDVGVLEAVVLDGLQELKLTIAENSIIAFPILLSREEYVNIAKTVLGHGADCLLALV